MNSDDLDFELPPELIAQAPVDQRAQSRLAHFVRSSGALEHRVFSQLPDILRPGDVLVFNDTKVVRARFDLVKSTGGRVEGLFLSEPSPGRWRVLLRGWAGALGSSLRFEARENLSARITAGFGNGEYELAVGGGSALELLEQIGRMPLPPYIRREKGSDPRDELDKERYQTVYARFAGAVAAPTAGLHFSRELLAELDKRQIAQVHVTLHVGLGTFRPVTAVRLQDHTMHAERYEIGAAAAETLNAAKRDRRRLIAVGTTSARVLESQQADQPFVPRSEQTSIFIYPPYRWKHMDGLVTNFHLPKSTLIAMVAALTGLEEQRRIYREAIERGYRFFSYGDAMFVE